MIVALAATMELAAQSVGAPYSKVECVNLELDGSITVRVTGSGRNKKDAMEQAFKNAVYNVIFKGVKTEDRNAAISRPLIFEVNAEEKLADFTKVFFKDKGKYTDFISTKDCRPVTSVHNSQGDQVEWTTVVRVLRPELQKYLIQQNIIKQ